MVEDSDEDYVATTRAFKKAGCESLTLERVADANQALDFLLTCGSYQAHKLNENLPALILLDLNLPGIDGRELLVMLKNDDRYKEIPVIILSTSNNPRDISYCFKNGANSYQVKPVGFEKYLVSIKSMISYWLGTAKIPATNS